MDILPKAPIGHSPDSAEIAGGVLFVQDRGGTTSLSFWDKIEGMIRIFRMRKLIRVCMSIKTQLGDHKRFGLGLLYGHAAGSGLFEEWYYTPVRYWKTFRNETDGVHAQKGRFEKQIKRLESVLSSCRDRKYLIVDASGLHVGIRGEEFIEIGQFTNTALKEFGTITSIIVAFTVGIIGTSLGGVIWRFYSGI